jgi:DNA-binding NarL/FixJ family response regulator
MTKIKLGILEDVEAVRASLAAYFLEVDDFDLMVTASNAEEFLLNPAISTLDLLLCDIGLPGKSGIELTWHLKNRYPQIQILMCTVFEEDDKIFEAIRAGASGYLLKSATLSELSKALLDVSAGGSAMSPSIARKVINFFKPAALFSASRIEPLTEQELRIVQLVVEGHNNRNIADQMCISIDTIKYHIKKIYKKLHINSRQELERTPPKRLFL